MKPLLSILTPSIPSRLCNWKSDEFLTLPEKIEQQVGDDWRVEHLMFFDNKRRTVGAKRQALLDIARGQYVAFVDDDDWISDDYLAELLPRCASGSDVVTFEQDATVDGVTGRIIFDANCRIDEPWKAGGTARRRPWHVCAWRRELAVQGVFTERNYGEDAAWVNQVAPLARNHLHIPKVLHYYRHSSESTEAPPPN
jgi:glycosyltransferase involved in cell wall biosynthesis